jgi:cell division protein FtsL
MPDVSFQPKSTMPEDVKKGPSLAEIFAGIVGLYKGEKKSIIVILLTITLLFVGVAIGAMMALNANLQGEVATLKAQLDAKDSAVMKPVMLKEIKTLSERVRVVTQVVKAQPFMTTFLKLLEYSVEDDIVFEKTTLTFLNLPGKGDLYTLSIDARANKYSAVLNQFQTLQEQAPYKNFFTDIKLNNFNVGKEGKISFKITGNASITGLPPEEAESQLLKVLSPGDVPPSEAFAPPVNEIAAPVTGTTTP